MPRFVVRDRPAQRHRPDEGEGEDAAGGPRANLDQTRAQIQIYYRTSQVCALLLDPQPNCIS
jgi:hypothetical protein